VTEGGEAVRQKIIHQIDALLSMCRTCPKKKELQIMARIDGYCNKQCETGQNLQQLGRDLETGRGIKIPTWWDREEDIMCDPIDYIMGGGDVGSQ